MPTPTFTPAPSSSGRFQTLFPILVRLLGALFFLLGFMKLHGLFTTASRLDPWLDQPNPIFAFLPNRGVLFLAGWLEMLVGAFAFARRAPLPLRTLALLWFSGLTLGYKFLLAWVR